MIIIMGVRESMIMMVFQLCNITNKYWKILNPKVQTAYSCHWKVVW